MQFARGISLKNKNKGFFVLLFISINFILVKITNLFKFFSLFNLF
jgi:hypothetical protein